MWPHSSFIHPNHPRHHRHWHCDDMSFLKPSLGTRDNCVAFCILHLNVAVNRSFQFDLSTITLSSLTSTNAFQRHIVGIAVLLTH